MKKILILIALISTISFCVQNSTDSTLSIYPKWKLNDMKNVEYISHITYKNDYSADTIKITTKGNFEVRVISVTRDGFVISLVFKDFDFKTIPDNPAPLMRDFANLMEKNVPLPIKLKFDKRGEFVDLVNWTEYKKYFYSAIDSVAKILKKENIIFNDSNIEDIKKKYSKKEEITNNIMKNILPFFSIYTLDLKNVNEDVVKMYLKLKSINDSIYVTNKTDITNEPGEPLEIKQYTYLDSTQKSKIKNIIKNPNINNNLKYQLEPFLTLYQKEDYLIDKANYWLLNMKATTISNLYNISIEYKIK